MPFWTDLLIDEKKISSIYSDELPTLERVDLHEITFHRDGPKVILRFNLEKYPSKPPKKWVVQEFNTVQIQLTILDVKDVILSGWIKTSYVVDISVERYDSLINLCIENDIFSLRIKSKFLDVSSISAYMLNK
ncbi:hypothetical protein YKD1_03510 [Yersinia pseudotuberculosis]|uniref:Imm50 family immunity protein n=1 Tax=Yersinia pseudotuberculosis TaxID=633 RepID=UPI0038B5A92E